MYRATFNDKKSMRAVLGDTYKDAWIPGRKRSGSLITRVSFWSKPTFKRRRNKRTQGMMQCVWNNVRAMVGAPPLPEPAAIAVKEEDLEATSEPVRTPSFFIGELPQNAIVDISAYNRHQTAFIEAVNKPPLGYKNDAGAKRTFVS